MFGVPTVNHYRMIENIFSGNLDRNAHLEMLQNFLECKIVFTQFHSIYLQHGEYIRIVVNYVNKNQKGRKGLVFTYETLLLS